MASSGSYDFTLTRDNLIDMAYQHAQILGEGESANATQVTEASRLLNMIVKLRAADDMPVWAIKRGFILPFSDSSSINTNSHVVTFYDSTAIAADVTSGTTITVDSAGTIANSDQIGIELDDGTMHWTTVSSGGGTTTLVIALTLTGTAGASDGNRVYAYTASADRVQKPIRVYDAQIKLESDSTGYEIDVEDRPDYWNTGARTEEGVPNRIYYTIAPSSDTALETNGTFYIYPRFVDGKYVIEFSYQRPFQDFDSSTDNPDFPQAFYLPLMLELATLLAPKGGLTIEEKRDLRNEAHYYREEALETIREEGSLQIQPDDRWR